MSPESVMGELIETFVFAFRVSALDAVQPIGDVVVILVSVDCKVTSLFWSAAFRKVALISLPMFSDFAVSEIPESELRVSDTVRLPCIACSSNDDRSSYSNEAVILGAGDADIASQVNGLI